MKQSVLLLTVTLCLMGSSVYAEYTVSNRGEWPETWPQELEPLREQSRTLEGPRLPQLHFQIPFKTREQFEAAWPHLLKISSQGAPLILWQSSQARLGNFEAGVFIHTPPSQFKDEVNPDTPGETIKKGSYWRYYTYIELIVDGKIVDLNRIQIPPDTLIIDKRFEVEKQPSGR